MKCEDPNHKRYPCPNYYGHVVHIEQAEGEPSPIAALKTAERILSQDSYCPVCDACDMCDFRTTPGPAPVWQFGMKQEGGVVRLFINDREVGGEEFYDTLAHIPGLRPPGMKVEAIPFPGGLFDLARRLEEGDGFGFAPPGATPTKMLKALIREAVNGAGLSRRYVVDDLLAAPEREQNSLGEVGLWALLLIFLVEAARRAGFPVGRVLEAAHGLVDQKRKDWGADERESAVSALDAKHKVVTEPATGGYLCVPCGATVRPNLGPGAVMGITDWASRRDEFFAEHGRPRI